MASKFIAIVLIALFSVATSAPSNFAVGGQNAVLGQYPATVAIEFPENRFCGGVILNANHILTAGSCVLNLNRHLVGPNQVQVTTGVVTLPVGGPRTAIIRVYVHPQFNPYSFENDIAVLRTATNMVFPTNVVTPNVAPAEMNHHIVSDGSNCFFAGWLIGLQAQPTLQSLTVITFNRDQCNIQNSIAGTNTTIFESNICANTIQPLTSGVCLSNRGGGLFCNGKLSGILSNGFGCGTQNVPQSYTQIRFFEQWIQEQFSRTDNPAPGPTPQPGVDVNRSSNPLYGALNLIVISIIIQLFRFIPIKF